MMMIFEGGRFCGEVSLVLRILGWMIVGVVRRLALRLRWSISGIVSC